MVSFSAYSLLAHRFAAMPRLTGSPSLCTSEGRLAVSPASENGTAVLEKAAVTTTLQNRPHGKGTTLSVSVVTVRFSFPMFTSCMLHVSNIHLHDVKAVGE